MTKNNYELDLQEIHIKKLNELIPFFGEDINEVIKYALIKFIDDFVFQNKFSIMRKELNYIDKKKE
ncbi:MAG: hypothetical protein E3J52_10415 [Promethearchaeota archaeon]|nr:MAG: hypothetical protein E3J52_10415 [Candidatus Lokiarchaeota archaeon]